VVDYSFTAIEYAEDVDAEPNVPGRPIRFCESTGRVDLHISPVTSIIDKNVYSTKPFNHLLDHGIDLFARRNTGFDANCLTPTFIDFPGC
jgi:hypothetical protein